MCMHIYELFITTTQQGISERLSNTESDCDVGWLSVNQRPVKDTLNTLTSKWKAVYAGYLERRVREGREEGKEDRL